MYAERPYAEFLGPWRPSEIALVNTAICTVEAATDGAVPTGEGRSDALDDALTGAGPFGRSHRWVCVVVYDDATSQTLYYATRWVDRTSGLVAHSAHALAERIRNAT